MLSPVSQSQKTPSFGANLKIYDYQNRLSKVFSIDDLKNIEKTFAQKTFETKGELRYIAKYGTKYIPDSITYMNQDFYDSVDVLRDNKVAFSVDTFVDKLVAILKAFKMKESATVDIIRLQKQINNIKNSTQNYCSKIIKENFETP